MLIGIIQNQQMAHLTCQKKEKLLSILLIISAQHDPCIDSSSLYTLALTDYKNCFWFASQLHSYKFCNRSPI